MKTYAIIGGGGFVGTNLALYLLARGDSVHCMDNLTHTQPQNIKAMKVYEEFHFHEGDVRDRGSLEKFLSEDYDGVFHLASLVGIKTYLN